MLGHYVLKFDDHSFIDWPVEYGLNITGSERSWELQFSEKYDVYNGDASLLEVSYTALVTPLPTDGRKMTAMRLIPEPNKDDSVFIREVRIMQSARLAND